MNPVNPVRVVPTGSRGLHKPDFDKPVRAEVSGRIVPLIESSAGGPVVREEVHAPEAGNRLRIVSKPDALHEQFVLQARRFLTFDCRR
jgi:hypothetical protein